MSNQQYYDTTTQSFIQPSWMRLTDTQLISCGILPYRSSPVPIFNEYTELLFFGGTVCSDRSCWQAVEIRLVPANELPAKLDQLKHAKQAEFATFFGQLDAKKARPAADVAEALALGSTPDTEDVARLSTLNALAKENRALLQAVMETSIPEDATQEAAQAIILQVMSVTPQDNNT